jgi:hypothetical protein
MDANAELERGRRHYHEQAWLSAFECLTTCDQVESLCADDLELLARSAYMIGRDDIYVASLERACQALLDAGAVARAVRCRFWIGHSFLFRGEKARGAGWFARAQRLLDSVTHDCVERGYLCIPALAGADGARRLRKRIRHHRRGPRDRRAVRRCHLVWLARDDQARALLRLGRDEEGLRLVDEALIAAGSGELSPIVTGIVYCNTIAFCRARYEVRRVREWTSALTRWCDHQPEMVAHNGLCLVHRAEIMMLQGSWAAALEEARRSPERFFFGCTESAGGWSGLLLSGRSASHARRLRCG